MFRQPYFHPQLNGERSTPWRTSQLPCHPGLRSLRGGAGAGPHYALTSTRASSQGPWRSSAILEPMAATSFFNLGAGRFRAVDSLLVAENDGVLPQKRHMEFPEPYGVFLIYLFMLFLADWWFIQFLTC